GDTGGLIVPAFSLAHIFRKWIIEAAETYALPAIYSSRTYTDPATNTKCGLISFGPNVSKLYAEVAGKAKEFIRGNFPADQVRDRIGFIVNPDFEIVINRNTADALNLTPPNLVFVNGKPYSTDIV